MSFPPSSSPSPPLLPLPLSSSPSAVTASGSPCRRPSSSSPFSSSAGANWSLSQHHSAAAAVGISGGGGGAGSDGHYNANGGNNAAASLLQSSGAGGGGGGEGGGGGGRKSVVMVKLTDAAIKALEEYVKLANEAALSNTEIPKPSIKFPSENNHGEFSIPLSGVDQPHDEVSSADFAFSLSSAEDAQGPQGSFECLQAAAQGCLQSIGPLQEKLQVQASDDSYTRFGQKMFQAKQESEKRTTQFLDRGPGSSSAVRVVRPQVLGNRRLRGAVIGVPPSSTSSASALNGSSSNSNSSSSAAISRLSSTGAINSSLNSAGGGQAHHHSFLSGTHPMLDRKNNSSYLKHPNTEVMRRPLKERIIHLLAVRPFKKPELIIRINRDGIREKDRKNITVLLKQVSFMKDNTYHLIRHMWNDVSEDWPFYSEQEKQSLKRRKPQNLTPPCSDGSTSSSGHSPSSSHLASPPRPSHHHLLNHDPSLSPTSPSRGGGGGGGSGGRGGSTTSQKRPHSGGSGGYDSHGEMMDSKKRRVSNFVRPPDMINVHNNGFNSDNGRSVGANSPRYILGTSPKTIQQHSASPPSMGSSSPKISSPGGGGGGARRSSGSGGALSSGFLASTLLNGHHQQQQQQPVADYVLHYAPIESKNQRDIYKEDFNAHYAKYRKLHSLVNAVSKRFSDLEAELNQLQAGSNSWKRMKSKIMQEYAARQQDKKYVENKKEFQYLHEKLAHIKGLVTQYDQNAISSSSN